MGKQILAVLLGVISGSLVVVAGDALAQWMYPIDETWDKSDPNTLLRYMEQVDGSALVIMTVGWLLSAFTGGFFAGYISPKQAARVSVVAGFVLFLGAAVNLYLIPHPVWMTLTAVIGYLPSARIGGQVALRLRSR
jgi:hypothetical protein